MKTNLIKFPILSLVYLVTWIAGMAIGLIMFAVELPEGDGGFDLNLVVVSLLHTAILYVFIRYASIQGWKLFAALIIVSYGITFFITQVETLWFNNAVQMDPGLLKALLIGGLISVVLFSASAVNIIPSLPGSEADFSFKFSLKGLVWLTVLAVVVWPMIYFLAGYFIAWQSESVRIYYSGSAELASFGYMMKENLASGLYTFQIIRGIIWLGIAFVIHLATYGRSARTIILLTAGLFAVLGSSQLLLENSLMPEQVRYVHLLEVGVSTFVWGLIAGRGIFHVASNM